jgi:hypothetical protein
VAELHVLENRQELLVEAAARDKVGSADGHRVRRDVVRGVRVSRFVVVDEDRLERREEAGVEGLRLVGAADPDPAAARATATRGGLCGPGCSRRR